jgi:hypothetical protein
MTAGIRFQTLWLRLAHREMRLDRPRVGPISVAVPHREHTRNALRYIESKAVKARIARGLRDLVLRMGRFIAM